MHRRWPLTQCAQEATRGSAWSSAVLLLHRARVAAALGDLDRAIADLRQGGELAQLWGVENPAMMPWRSQLAVALAARAELEEGQRLASVELGLARRWGAPRPIGIALHAAGLTAGRDGDRSLSRAVDVLRAPTRRSSSRERWPIWARSHAERATARELGSCCGNPSTSPTTAARSPSLDAPAMSCAWPAPAPVVTPFADVTR